MSSMFMGFSQKPEQSQKQLQRLIMLPQMQQAIKLMQMPVLELCRVLEEELEQNPVLEYDELKPNEVMDEGEERKEIPSEEELKFDEDFKIMKTLDEDFKDYFSESENYYTKRTSEEEKLKSYLEQSIRAEKTLFEHLMTQAKETFEDKEEIKVAEILIGSLDESGFFRSSLKEIAQLNSFSETDVKKVFAAIKTFDPYGVGAESLRECLLIQLAVKGGKSTLAYKIVENHFDDLIHNRIPRIKKALKCSVEEIQSAIKEKISRLDLHPGAVFSSRPVQPIIPDVAVIQEDLKLTIIINNERLPIIRLNTRYLRMLYDERVSKENKDYIKNKLMSAKWLLKNIDQRNDTLYRVTEAISKHQSDFFQNVHGKLVPLTMKSLAEELDLHESTIARAVANKYVDAPKGIFPLRYFFTNAFTTKEGNDISSKTVRDLLKRYIEKENKKRPLSDEALSKLLEKKGIPCARRTIAKYRREMQIGNTKQRRVY